MRSTSSVRGSLQKAASEIQSTGLLRKSNEHIACMSVLDQGEVCEVTGYERSFGMAFWQTEGTADPFEDSSICRQFHIALSFSGDPKKWLVSFWSLANQQNKAAIKKTEDLFV